MGQLKGQNITITKNFLKVFHVSFNQKKSFCKKNNPIFVIFTN